MGLKKGREIFWPDMNSPRGIEMGIKSGWIACVITCFLTVIIGFLNFNKLNGYVLWGNVIEALIMAFVGYGIFKKSRVAAIFGVIIWSLEIFYKLQSGEKIGIGILIYLYLI